MATKFLIPITVWSLLLGSCSISRQQMSSFSDDVYSSPSELKAIAKAKVLAQAKQDSIARQAQADSAAAQTARDNANPYYQDPTYNKDDYYDYEYASRINRFNSPMAGAGYYDNYYTNMYTYNQNPACYGTSIYSTYNYMPSTQFAMMNSGIGMGFGNSFYNGYNMGYSNFGYGIGYGNPYGMGYSTYPYYSNSIGYYNYNPYYSTGFYNGYNTGYYNGYYNNGWGGYLNTYDPNSAYANMDYAPRTSGNTNSAARVAGGTQTPSNDGRQQLYNAYVQQQNNTPRFSNSASRSTNLNNATFNQSRTNGSQNTNLNNGGNRATQGQPQTNYGNNNSTRVNNEGNRASRYDNNTNNNPTGRSTNENNGWNQNNGGWNNESGRSSGGFNGGGGGFSPRGGGGGGGRGGR